MLEKFYPQVKLNCFLDEQLKVLLLDFFMAGAESTSSNLSTAIFYMMTHPEIQKKVQQNIDSAIPKDRLPTLQDRVR